MTVLFWLVNIAGVISLAALVMTVWNLRLYRPVTPELKHAAADDPLICVCVPARNEQANLAACVRSVLACGYTNVEVLIYDDHSTDDTAAIIQELSLEDSRVRQVATRALPQGWNGKQFGCDQMGRAASGPWLLFTDADVRFEGGALHSACRAATQLDADLISTFPRQVTGSPGETLLVPMIMFILFSYLPMIRMRRSCDPSASAGCGQFLLVRRQPWLDVGGHAAFKDSMHDGIKLPRLLRMHGYHTDLFDATDLLHVRMYSGWSSLWRGFAKNAYEGLGHPAVLILLTVLHLLGHVLPWVVLPAAIALGVWSPALLGICAAIMAIHVVQRLMLAERFAQSRLACLAHPVSIVLMVLVQWHSAWLHWRGRRTWRGRTWRGNAAPVSVK